VFPDLLPDEFQAETRRADCQTPTMKISGKWSLSKKKSDHLKILL
jgi:hypothetical protein